MAVFLGVPGPIELVVIAAIVLVPLVAVGIALVAIGLSQRSHSTSDRGDWAYRCGSHPPVCPTCGRPHTNTPGSTVDGKCPPAGDGE